MKEKKIEVDAGRLHPSRFITLAEAGKTLVEAGRAPAGIGAAQTQIRRAVERGEIPVLHKTGQFFILQKKELAAWIKALDKPGFVAGRPCYSLGEATDVVRRRLSLTKARAVAYLAESPSTTRKPFIYFNRKELDARIDAE